MFNKKLKAKILELEKQVLDGNKKIAAQEVEIKSLKWQLDNPPKYKIGDKIGHLIVVDRRFNVLGFKELLVNGLMWVSIAYFTAKKADRKRAIDNYIAKMDTMNWEYELIDTVTGKRLNKKEAELNG